jgi:hypothetical protein
MAVPTNQQQQQQQNQQKQVKYQRHPTTNSYC